jgi:hypothetical protein
MALRATLRASLIGRNEIQPSEEDVVLEEKRS